MNLISDEIIVSYIKMSDKLMIVFKQYTFMGDDKVINIMDNSKGIVCQATEVKI